jgi:hypothetical protein
MAVKLYSDILLQITNFNLLRTGFRATHRHECLPAERWAPYQLARGHSKG